MGTFARWCREEAEVRGRLGRSCAFAERAVVSAFALVVVISARPDAAEARNEGRQPHATDQASQGRIPHQIHLVSQSQRIYAGSHLPSAHLFVGVYRNSTSHRQRQEPLLAHTRSLPAYLDATLRCYWPVNRTYSRSAPTLRRTFPLELEINQKFDPGKVTQLPRALVVNLPKGSVAPGADRVLGHLWREGQRKWREGQQTWTMTLEPRFFEIIKGELDYLDHNLRVQLRTEYAENNGVFVPIDKLASVASDKQDFVSTHKRNVTLRGTSAYEHQDGLLYAFPQRRTDNGQSPAISAAGGL